MTQEQLDLLQFAASRAAQFGAGASSIMRGNAGDADRLRILPEHLPDDLLSQAFAPRLIGTVHGAEQVAVRRRKNALFYRTLHGAEAGDLFMSLIYTCELAGANPFDYLTELQRHARELAENPSAWMRVESWPSLLGFGIYMSTVRSCMRGNAGDADRLRILPEHLPDDLLSQAFAPRLIGTVHGAEQVAVRHRKNALFYRTLHGAEAGDLFMSLIYTCDIS